MSNTLCRESIYNRNSERTTNASFAEVVGKLGSTLRGHGTCYLTTDGLCLLLSDYEAHAFLQDRALDISFSRKGCVRFLSSRNLSLPVRQSRFCAPSMYTRYDYYSKSKILFRWILITIGKTKKKKWRVIDNSPFYIRVLLSFHDERSSTMG